MPNPSRLQYLGFFFFVLAQHVIAHSLVVCTDYDNGVCRGYPRNLDIYEYFTHGDAFVIDANKAGEPCSEYNKFLGASYSAMRPKATSKAGSVMTISWPANNHQGTGSVPLEGNVQIWASTDRQPPLSLLSSTADYTLPFNSCEKLPASSDLLSGSTSDYICQGNITMPQAPGLWTFVWRWQIGQAPFYSCWDVEVAPREGSMEEFPTPSLKTCGKCDCPLDGIVNGVDTKRMGCKAHEAGVDPFCHVSASCDFPNLQVSTEFPTTKILPCDPLQTEAQCASKEKADISGSSNSAIFNLPVLLLAVAFGSFATQRSICTTVPCVLMLGFLGLSYAAPAPVLEDREHLYAPVENFQLVEIGPNPGVSASGHPTPFAHNMQLNFSAFGRDFFLHLSLMHGLFTEDMEPEPLYSYLGTSSDSTIETASVTVHDPDHVYAVIMTDSDFFTVTPRRHLDFEGSSANKSGMVVSKLSDVTPTELGEDPSTSRRLLIDRFRSNCYPGMATGKTAIIRIAFDVGFRQATSTVGGHMALAQQYLASTNAIYIAQFSVGLAVAEYYQPPTAGNPAWNRNQGETFSSSDLLACPEEFCGSQRWMSPKIPTLKPELYQGLSFADFEVGSSVDTLAVYGVAA